MTDKDITAAYNILKEANHCVPKLVLEFMYLSALEKVKARSKLEQRKRKFADKIAKAIEAEPKYRSIARDFYEYWTEHGDNDRKMRFEKEKSFGLARRLGTWLKNDKKFNNERDTKKDKIQRFINS